jgi:hypothetical protein
VLADDPLRSRKRGGDYRLIDTPKVGVVIDTLGRAVSTTTKDKGGRDKVIPFVSCLSPV